VVVLDGTNRMALLQQAERWADTAWTLQWLLRAWVPGRLFCS